MHSVLDYLHNVYDGFNYELSPVIFSFDVLHKQADNLHSYAKQALRNQTCNKNKGRKRKRVPFDFILNGSSHANQGLNSEESSCNESNPIPYINMCTSDGKDINIAGNTVDIAEGNECNITNVANICTVETSYPSEDFLCSNLHNSDYELHIRQKPSAYCGCCDRILFSDQKVYLKRVNEMSAMLNLPYDSVLCRYCHHRVSRNEPCPLNSKKNNLDAGLIPRELSELSILEKRMIALIQIFMSIHILPGGQYAEKGLVLNLPMNVQEIANQLPRKFSDDCTLSVHFLHNEPVITDRHFVSCRKLKDAIVWLVQNNPLYSEISVSNSIDRLQNQSSKDSTSPMSETCKIRTRQVKFQDHKPDWACKIVESKLKKILDKTNQNSFF